MDDQYSTALEGHHFFNEFNPGIGVTRKLGETGLIGNTYATYKESSRTPSVAELGWQIRTNLVDYQTHFKHPPLDQKTEVRQELEALKLPVAYLVRTITLVGMLQHLLEEITMTLYSLEATEWVLVTKCRYTKGCDRGIQCILGDKWSGMKLFVRQSII